MLGLGVDSWSRAGHRRGRRRCCLFVLAWLGADVATRFQFVVMAVLVAALASFYVGAFGCDSTPASWRMAGARRRARSASGSVFAIFFPAVTGFTQGVSMSGDLKDPGRSLPRGTFAAVGLSTVVYVVGGDPLRRRAAPQRTSHRRHGGDAVRSRSSGLLIDAGVDRRHALVGDGLVPRRAAHPAVAGGGSGLSGPQSSSPKGHGPTNNPRRGVLLSAGDRPRHGRPRQPQRHRPRRLDVLPHLLRAAQLRHLLRGTAPRARPSGRGSASSTNGSACSAPWPASARCWPSTSFAGVAALLVMFVIYQYLSRRPAPERWADSPPSHYFQRAKESIRAMSNEEQHARNWRPQVLAFSADPRRRERLIRFASWLEGGSGLTVAVRVLQGEGAVMRRQRDHAADELRAEIEALGLDVYSRVVLAADGMEALPVVVQSFGVGAPQGQYRVVWLAGEPRRRPSRSVRPVAPRRGPPWSQRRHDVERRAAVGGVCGAIEAESANRRLVEQ